MDLVTIHVASGASNIRETSVPLFLVSHVIADYTL